MRRNYDIEETCEILNISKQFLYKLWRMGKGPRITKIGRRTFVSSIAIEDYLASLESTTTLKD